MLKRVFISYVHRDGGDLAVRPQRDLENRGFDVRLHELHWLDFGDPIHYAERFQELFGEYGTAC
jgi:hypothetical protein